MRQEFAYKDNDGCRKVAEYVRRICWEMTEFVGFVEHTRARMVARKLAQD